jgi:6-phosphofructokinase 2
MSIVTVSLNPTIDMASEANVIHPTNKTRTYNESYDPGGGGVNVARVIKALGGDASVICLAGGFTGQLLDELMGEHSIDRTIVPIKGNTRVSVTIFERKSGQEYRFIPNGPRLEPDEVAACLAAIEACDCTHLVASGSVPLGAPTDILARIAGIAASKGARFILDSSGAGLSETLEQVPVYLVKPSIGELETLVGRRLDHEATRAAAMDLIERGRAEIVAVTLGASGVLIATHEGVRHIAAPPVPVRSAVGAGDSFVAAITLALAEGRDLEDACLYAVAAGAAAVMTSGTQMCQGADVERIHGELRAGLG